MRMRRCYFCDRRKPRKRLKSNMFGKVCCVDARSCLEWHRRELRHLARDILGTARNQPPPDMRAEWREWLKK